MIMFFPYLNTSEASFSRFVKTKGILKYFLRSFVNTAPVREFREQKSILGNLRNMSIKTEGIKQEWSAVY